MKPRGLLKVPKKGEKVLYLNRPEWRWYQKYLPDHLRIEGEHIPAEEWWDYEGHPVHIDRYAVAAPRAKIILFHGGGGNGRILGPFARMAKRANCEPMCL